MGRVHGRYPGGKERGTVRRGSGSAEGLLFRKRKGNGTGRCRAGIRGKAKRGIHCFCGRQDGAGSVQLSDLQDVCRHLEQHRTHRKQEPCIRRRNEHHGCGEGADRIVAIVGGQADYRSSIDVSWKIRRGFRLHKGRGADSRRIHRQAAQHRRNICRKGRSDNAGKDPEELSCNRGGRKHVQQPALCRRQHEGQPQHAADAGEAKLCSIDQLLHSHRRIAGVQHAQRKAGGTV